MNLTLVELGWIERLGKGYVPTPQGLGLSADRADFQGIPYVVWPVAIRDSEILADALRDSTAGVAEKPARAPDETVRADDPRQAFPAQYRAADGHYVRSRAELAIDNWLYMQGLVHAYERRVPIAETVISDFYLPVQRIYIEYWGRDDPEYLDRKRAKQALYDKHGLRLVNVEDVHLDNLDDALPRLLIPHGVECS